MKTDRQCPGPSASLVETEESPESKEGDLDTPEPAAERDIQIEYTCYYLCSTNMGAVTKNY